MVFAASILFALVLPSVMGLTLNTPTDAVAEGDLAVTWTTQSGDPKFTLLLSSATETIDLAQGIDPTTLNDTVALGSTPPGSGYTLTAVVQDDIETVLSKTDPFSIAAAGAAGAANNAGASAAGTSAAAAGTGAAAPTIQEGPGIGRGGHGAAGAAAQAAAAKGAKGAAAAKGAAKAGAAGAKGAAAGNNAATAKVGVAAGGRQRPGRSVASVKFGRRELYRD